MEASLPTSSVDLTELLSANRFGNVIAGEVDSRNARRTHPVLNPSTGEPIVEVPVGSAQDVARAVDAAREALPEWRRRTPAARAATLLRLADVVDEHAESFARLESLNVGKPLSMARDEIPMISDVFRFMAGALRATWTPATEEYVDGYVSMIRREPLGVVGAITPWNYPLLTASWKIAPALGAGNTLVVKPSELTPLTTVLFAHLTRDVLPPGVLNVVCGTGPDTGQALADHPGIDAISLTGSVSSGIKVARAGAQTLKHVHLELGGKAPVVVFEDADLEAVVDTLRTMGFWNTGQECGAATRVICADSVKDALIEKLCAAAGSLAVGSPDEGDGIDMGPLISDVHRRRVHELVEAAVRDGATLALGGVVDGRPGFFYPPTVLADIPADSAILRNEIFGPVVTVETFAEEDDAIDLANNSAYGLAASVWTESGRRGLRLSEALNYGTVWINTHLVVASEMPWGGYGMSGTGRELSSYGLDDFTRTKHVMIAK